MGKGRGRGEGRERGEGRGTLILFRGKSFREEQIGKLGSLAGLVRLSSSTFEGSRWICKLCVPRVAVPNVAESCVAPV